MAWPKLLTKHVTQSGYEKALAGSFGFGTTAYFRENHEKGFLMSDGGEGVVTENLVAGAGETTSIDGFSFSNGTSFVGCTFENPLDMDIVPFRSRRELNDYVACFCPGGFSRERAAKFQKHGNDDYIRYVVYDTRKLLTAVGGQLKVNGFCRRGLKSSDVFFGRPITYGDRSGYKRSVNGKISGTVSNDDEGWLRTTFVKPSNFEYEEEFRLVFMHGAPGALPENTGYLEVASRAISSAIVDNGDI